MHSFTVYTVDPATEASCREGCFYLPTSLSRRQKSTLTKTMWDCVALQKRFNPLVGDFKMACEQFATENVKNGRVVISANAKPASEHERRYNLQVIEFKTILLIIIIIIIIINATALQIHPFRFAPTKFL